MRKSLPFRSKAFTADDAEHAIILAAKMIRQEFSFEFTVYDGAVGVLHELRPHSREGQKYLARIVRQT